jgi:hypothetical protein
VPGGGYKRYRERAVEAVTYRIVKVVPYATPVATLDKDIEQNVNTKGPKRHT